MNEKIENRKLKKSIVRTVSFVTLATLTSLGCSSSGGGGNGEVPLALNITPTNGEAVGSNGVGLLNENTDGSTTPAPLGTIDDNKNANDEAYYALSDDTEGTDNGKFEITEITGDTATQILQFKGEDSGDFETGDQLTLKMERYNNKDNADAEGGGNPQMLQYIVNLKDVVPKITGYLPLAEGQTVPAEIDTYTAASIVGEAILGTNTGNDIFEIIFGAVAEGQTFTIDFVTGDEGFLIKTEPQYVDPENPSSETLTGFIITTGRQSSFTVIVDSLNSGSIPFDPSEEAQADFTTWQSYAPSIKHLVGTPSLAPGDGGTDLYSNSWTLTGRATIEVVQNTTGTIADFNSPDGSYSLAGTDAGLFDITVNGRLTFKSAPTFNTGANADNYYEITIEVSDGTHSDTYDLFVVVVDM